MRTLTMDAATRQTQIDRLLAAARETIVAVPFCWVVTPNPDGVGANARVVKAQRPRSAMQPGRESLPARSIMAGVRKTCAT